MPRPKILIADDSRSMQIFYNIQLPDEQFEKRIAGNGQEAINVYSIWKPDLILLDIHMPVVDGFNTLKAIREDMHDKTVAVIMITSQSDKDKVLACADLGIQGYIIKPFKKEELLDKITKCLAKENNL